MELNNNLQILIARAWVLHDEICDKIHDNSISFCRYCSENVRCCGVTETPLERERLIAIRDSLKNVENVLVLLQKINSWQQRDRYAALARLEQSRLILMEKVTQYQGIRALDVIEELNTYFADTKTTHNWNLKRIVEKMTEPKSKKGTPHFLRHWIWSFLNPWNWHNTARVAVKLILVTATISSAFRLCKTRQESDRSRTKVLSFVDSTTEGKRDFDVFHGRG